MTTASSSTALGAVFGAESSAEATVAASSSADARGATRDATVAQPSSMPTVVAAIGRRTGDPQVAHSPDRPRGADIEQGADHVRSCDVATLEQNEAIEQLRTTLGSIEAVLDLPALRAEAASLEEQAAAPDLWNDPEAAQKVTSRLSNVQGLLRRIGALRQRADDLSLMFELAEDEGDADALAEAETELAALTQAVSEQEVLTLLSGEYDAREALVTIRAEAGGVDAADWAEMLMRMYLRWVSATGTPPRSRDVVRRGGEHQVGHLRGKAPYAYGTLSVEQGTHRLVRISPFDNQGRRQTSFAGVEVVPVVEQTDAIEIPQDEIRSTSTAAAGPAVRA